MIKTTTECKHKEMVFYYPSINEDGWKCGNCDKKLGFRPDLDKKFIDIKVMGLLNDMHDKKLIYVSNGTTGECIMHNVVYMCEKKGVYDQYSIILFIMQDKNVNVESHARYWKAEAMKPQKMIGDFK